MFHIDLFLVRRGGRRYWIFLAENATAFKWDGFDTPFLDTLPHVCFCYWSAATQGTRQVKCHIVKKGDFPGVSWAIWASKRNSLCKLMLSFSLSLSCLFHSFFHTRLLQGWTQSSETQPELQATQRPAPNETVLVHVHVGKTNTWGMPHFATWSCRCVSICMCC